MRTDEPAPTGALTFLFTDIEESTRLWQDAPEAMQAALARHDAILRGGIEALGGRVFGTAGDAFYATFDVAQCALEAVFALQETLLAEAWPRETPIRVRMALHTGAAQSRDGDYFGPPLNVVARLLSVARGGQTLLTGAVRDVLDGARPERAEIESHGFYRLKGVEARFNRRAACLRRLDDSFDPWAQPRRRMSTAPSPARARASNANAYSDSVGTAAVGATTGGGASGVNS